MNARYYSSTTGQFTTRDTYLGNISNPATHNLYTYTGNNPINFIDPTGHAWYHWAIAAAIVVVAAVVVVATCGAALPAIAAITAVASGTVAATTASTVAAGVFIASSTALGFMAIDAAVNSNSIKEFMDKGDWGTVGATLSSAAMGGFSSYVDSKNMSSNAASEVNSSSINNASNIAKNGIAVNKLQPDSMAEGVHSTYKINSTTGEITNYKTWQPNLKNPTGFDLVKGYDGVGKPHTNSITKERLMPHIHDKTTPGGIRLPELWESPYKK